MLPYLAAIALLVEADLSASLSFALLAGYCVVIVAPALALLVVRLALHDRVSPWLERLAKWMSSHAENAVGWVLGIVGFFMAAQGIVEILGVVR